MILLDTNYLIRALVRESSEMEKIVTWINTGEDLLTSAVSWYEFICGPVDEEGISLVASLIEERILPFTADQAAEAARLFNETGRKRYLRIDAMIAAAAIISNSKLATENLNDFNYFTPLGLQLLD